MSRPLLSVVTPTYNRAGLVGRYLDSAQSIQVDCELVISDNASPDDTREVVLSHARRDPRIRYLRNETNIGGVRNYNRAMSEARGKYMCVFSDDDLHLPTNFEKKIALLEANPQVDLVYSLWYSIDLEGRSRGVVKWPGLVEFPYIGGRPEFMDLLAADYMASPSIVFRRELYDDLGGFDERDEIAVCGDWDMKLRYCQRAVTAFIPEPLLCVGYHDKSGTEGLRRSGLLSKTRLAIWRKWLVENDDPPVLEDRHWQILGDAFAPDLGYEFGDNRTEIQRNLDELVAIRRDHIQKVTARFKSFVVLPPTETKPAPGTASPSAVARTDTPKLVPTRPRDILWHAPIYDPSGYADEARHFLLALDRPGLPIAARPLGRQSSTFRAQLDRQTQQTLDRVMQQKVSPGFINLIHFPAYVFQRLPDAAYHIGRVMFETDGLPGDWVARCNEMDEIWVPTEFNLKTFRDAGVRSRLVKVPGGIDAEQFRPGLDPLPIPGARGTVFLAIFEWGYRKGWDVLLRAWANAFKPDQPVSLVLRTYPLNVTEGVAAGQEIESRVDRFLATALGLRRDQVAPIVVLGEQIPEPDLPRLFAAATAYVAPSRGEGWGRPHMQAMACGLPVIATRWSGNLEFMNDDNSLLLDIDGLVEIDDRAEIPFYRGQHWAEPSAAHLARLLRQVVEQPARAAAIGRCARRDMEERWSWDAVAAVAARRLSEIQAELDRSHGAAGLSSQKTLAIAWYGSQFVHHSLALVNRELCLGLIEGGQELSILPYERDQFGPALDPRFPALAQRVNARLPRPVDVTVSHRWPPDFTPPAQGHWVIMQPWEFGSIPRAWIEPMRTSVDEVWAYTNFVRECYIRDGLPADRVHVVPLGVNADLFRPEAAPLPLNTQKRYKFLFVGGTIGRKGIDVLLNAYLSAFKATDDVCLVIKDVGGNSVYKGQTLGEAIGAIQADPKAAEILYLTEDMAPADLPSLYTACDCLVHPYRGEGFGLPIAEAMACGLPVIVTGAGACLDFCDETVAYLIPATKATFPEKRVGDIETVDWPFLYEPDPAALMALMRKVRADPTAARVVGARASERIRQRFTWQQATDRALERMQMLSQQPIRRQTQGRPQQDAVVASEIGTRPAALVVNASHGVADGFWTSLVSTLGKTRLRGLSIVVTGGPVSALGSAKRGAPPAPVGWQLRTDDGPVAAALARTLGNEDAGTVVLLSADTVLTAGWLDRLLAALDSDTTAVVAGPTTNRGPKAQRIATKYQGTGNDLARFAEKRAAAHGKEAKDAAYLGGFCLAFDAQRCREIGPLGEDEPLAAALWDYFRHVRTAGHKAVVAVGAYVHHDRLSADEGQDYDELAEAEQAMQAALAEGNAALEAEDLARAADIFGRMAERYPDAFDGQVALAAVLMAAGRFAEAIWPLRRAVELGARLGPGLATIHNRLGVALYQTGDAAGAEAAFTQACQSNPQDIDGRLNLIDLYQAHERYVEATATVKEALQIDRDHPDVLVAFATLSLQLGDPSAARKAIDRLRTVASDHPQLAALAAALAAAG